MFPVQSVLKLYKEESFRVERHPNPGGDMSAPTFPKGQPTSTNSVQAPNAISSSLDDMFKVVTMIFQQIMTELNRDESEEDRIMAITKTVSKLMKQNGP
jgi:hypothetical protein